jgi:hypothetical protein
VARDAASATISFNSHESHMPDTNSGVVHELKLSTKMKKERMIEWFLTLPCTHLKLALFFNLWFYNPKILTQQQSVMEEALLDTCITPWKKRMNLTKEKGISAKRKELGNTEVAGFNISWGFQNVDCMLNLSFRWSLILRWGLRWW